MTKATDDWTCLDGVHAIWQYRYWILAATVLAGLATAAAMLVLPRTYEAITTVRIGRVMDKLLDDL